MSATTRLIVDRDFVIDSVPDRLFGSFAEHMGRSIYGGLYEPGHPSADGNGFRQDVLSLVREMGVTVVRYPGGNFVSGYRWEDGVGPKESRPRRREMAWMSTETNQFGTDDFIDWCRRANVEPMLAVNLGIRGPAEAGELFEYCNHPGGTAVSDRRRVNGHQEPHDVRLWCLGNEMDGPWQIGQLPAAEYGRKAREAAKLMRWPDQNRSRTPLPRAEMIACGSCARGMPTYGHWDQAVLEECFEQVEYLSVHSYVSPKDGPPQKFLAFADLTMAPLIREVTAIADAVAAKRRSRKRVNLCYDEWNVWDTGSDGPFDAWDEAPPLAETRYTMLDALCVGAMLVTLLNHCDRVKIACQAQLVNVLGPIMTRTGGPAWRQTIFHPFAQASRFARGGRVLRAVPAEAASYAADGADVPTVAAAVIRDGDGGGATVLAVNRNLAAAETLAVEFRTFGRLAPVEHNLLAHQDLTAINDEAAPDRVAPRRADASAVRIDGQTISVALPPASWNVVRLRPTA